MIIQADVWTTDIVILCVSGPVRKWLNEAKIFGSNRRDITTDLQHQLNYTEGSCRSVQVLNFCQIFKVWEFLENRQGPWKSLNL